MQSSAAAPTDLALIASHPLFGALQQAQLQRLVAYSKHRKVKAGRAIFAKGDRGDALFAIRSGTIKITAPSGDGREAVFNVLTDGEIFGDCYVFYIGQQAADQAVTDKFRLDAGSSCQRIEVSAKTGTPVPGATPAAAGEDHDADEGGSGSGDDSGGIPIWGLIAGIGVGMAVGLVGGRVLTGSK